MAMAPIQSQMLQSLMQLNSGEQQNVKGRVIAIEGNQVVVEVMGQKLTMSAESLQKLNVGQLLSFALVTLPDGKKALKLTGQSAPGEVVKGASSEASAKGNPPVVDAPHAFEGILKSQLKAFGVQVNEGNLSLVKAQRGHGLPMTKEAFLQLKSIHFHLEALATQISKGGAAGADPQNKTQALSLSDLQLPPEALAARLASGGKISSGAAATAAVTVPVPVTVTGADTTPVTVTKAAATVAGAETAKIQSPEKQVADNKGAEENSTTTTKLPPNAVVDLPIAKFGERALAILQGIVKQPESLDQTLAYMVKQGIPTQTIDVLLVSQYMKGSTGFTSAMTELLEALESLQITGEGVEVDIKELLGKLKNQSIPWTRWSSEMDGQQLKSQFETFSELTKALSELSIKSETGEYSDQFDALKRSVSISQDSSQWSNLFLPQPLSHMIKDVEIFIKRDKDKNRAIDPDNALLYIALDTENLGRVRVKIQTKTTHLSIAFMIESQPVRALFEKTSVQLYEAIKKHTGKDVQLVFQETIDDVNLAELEKVDKESLQLFDLRI